MKWKLGIAFLMYRPNEVGKRIFRAPIVTFSGAGGIFNWPREIMGRVIPSRSIISSKYKSSRSTPVKSNLNLKSWLIRCFDNGAQFPRKMFTLLFKFTLPPSGEDVSGSDRSFNGAFSAVCNDHATTHEAQFAAGRVCRLRIITLNVRKM